jgi:hypothetical protein
MKTTVRFGLIFILYYSLDICAQFELSKNPIGLVVFENRVVFSPPPRVFEGPNLWERAIKGYKKVRFKQRFWQFCL